MADVLSPKPQPLPSSNLSRAPDSNPTGPASLVVPLEHSKLRSGHLNLDTFSPVNHDGSFVFDRVLKNGKVRKRTRKTKVGSKYNKLLWICY